MQDKAGGCRAYYAAVGLGGILIALSVVLSSLLNSRVNKLASSIAAALSSASPEDSVLLWDQINALISLSDAARALPFAAACLGGVLLIGSQVGKRMCAKKANTSEAHDMLRKLPLPQNPEADQKEARISAMSPQPIKHHKVTHMWYLEKILLGLIEYDQLEDYYKFDLDFETAVVFIVNREEVRRGIGEATYYDDILGYILDNMCTDIFPSHFSLFFLELEYKLVGIALDRHRSEGFQQELTAGLRELSQHVEKLMGIRLYYSFSSVCGNLGDLARTYPEACYTQTYHYIRGESPDAAFYDDVKEQKCSYLDVPRTAEVEKRYIGLITHHEFVSAKQELLTLIDTIASMEGLYNRLVQTAIFDIVDMTLKGLSVLDQADVERMFDKFALINDMLGVDNLKSLREKCIYISDSLIQNFDTKSLGIREKITAVQSYIQVHYANADLGLNMIGDVFSISPQHLSKNFKELAGTGIQDYITSVRVSKSKQLLRQNESLSVAQVAMEVGFVSSQTFIRAFKRVEAVTPGQFRAQQSLAPSPGTKSKP